MTNITPIHPLCDEESIKGLEIALQEARAGRLREITIMGNRSGEFWLLVTPCENEFNRIGHLERYKHKMLLDMAQRVIVENV